MFDYFVVLAEMRTGSNFLEANLNSFEDLACNGELFNPHFIGHQKSSEMFGFDLNAREKAPLELISAMKVNTQGLAGFRFFNDHDPRVFEHVLNDKACAKIVLTRNPLDSYVSLKIAAQTGQWKLSDMKQRKAATITFDDKEFRDHLAAKQTFQLDILSRLQRTGQTAYYLAYEDVQKLDVMNGLAAWLGSDHQLEKLSKATKKQNPSPLKEKVTNYAAMEQALTSLDHFDLGRTPNFEPRRGPGVPGFVLSQDIPLLYVPILPVPSDRVVNWLSSLGSKGLVSDLSQKQLRTWMRENPGHRSFTVLSHPVERAYSAFCRHIFPISDDHYAAPRKIMRNRYGVGLPNENQMANYGIEDHRAAFEQFLEFLKGNLAGQTSVRLDPIWASQTSILEAAASVVLPDAIIRSDEADAALAQLVARFGRKSSKLTPALAEEPYPLEEIYSNRIEKLCFAAYRKDYIKFGFSPWQP